MLGTNEGVTDTNLLQYLGVIEERTNDLLLTQAYVSSQKVSSGLLTQTYPVCLSYFPVPVSFIVDFIDCRLLASGFRRLR